MSTLAGMPDPLDPIKKNAQQPSPPPTGLDPMEGLKNMARDAANAVRGQFAPQPRPAVNPLMGPDAGSTILPVLQAADTYMRGKTEAAISNAKDVPGTAVQGVKALGSMVAGIGEKPSSNYVGSGPTDPDTNGRKATPGVDLRVAAGQLADRVMGGVFGGDYQRERTQTPSYNPFAVVPKPAPAMPAPAVPAAQAPTPAAQPAPAAPAAPPAMAAATPEQKVQLAALISKQNNSRTPVSDPYAPVPGTQAPAVGMPPPGGSGGADLNGTPSQQTAYWAQQKAGLQERERYADQQATQQQAMGMMQADQDFKREMFNFLKDNGEKLGPAATQAIAHMSGQSVGAQAPASAGLTGLASMANHMAAAVGDAEKNALTARGQDLTFAGHQLTGKNDMSKAQLQADVTREGFAAQLARQAASDKAAGERTDTTAAATRHGYDTHAGIERAELAGYTHNPITGFYENKLGERWKGVELVPKPKQ